MSKSSTITEAEDSLDPIPPGEILQEDFLKPLGISQNRLARDISVPVSRVAGIVKGDRAITADTAIRLGQYLGTSADVWLGLQAEYDLRTARRAGRAVVKSSVIEAVEHDGRDRLTVTFVSAKRYVYRGVPPDIFRGLVEAESKGVFFNRFIRDAYASTDVTVPRGRAR